MKTIHKIKKFQYKRSLNFISQFGKDQFTFYITDNKEVQTYLVRRDNTGLEPGEEGYEFTKEDGTKHNVKLSQTYYCDCKGHHYMNEKQKRDKPCRHVAALLTLKKQKKID